MSEQLSNSPDRIDEDEIDLREKAAMIKRREK